MVKIFNLVRIQKNYQLFIKITFFLISFAFIFFYLKNSKYFGLINFDAEHYWRLSETFLDKNGNFSFINFFDNIRGYAYPFMLFIIKLVAKIINVNQFLILVLFNSFIFCLITTVLIPKIAELCFNIKVNYLFFIIIIFLCFIFGGIIFYIH